MTKVSGDYLGFYHCKNIDIKKNLSLRVYL